MNFSPPVVEKAMEVSDAPAHPRDAYNWHKVTHAIDEKREKYTRSQQHRTRDIIKATAKQVGASHEVQQFLLMVAMRESSWRGTQMPFDERGIIHRLNPDRESSMTAWRRQADRYKGNPAYDRSVDWNTYGPYGHNSALFLHNWDVMGHPRMLGDTVIATLTELRVMRHKLRKLHGHALCPVWDPGGKIKIDWRGRKWKVGKIARDEQGRAIRQRVKLQPTWHSLHRAVQGGRLCPAWKDDQLAAHHARRFARRCAKYGLDPHALVKLSDLGKEPDGNQYVLWSDIWASLGGDVLDGKM